VRDAGSQLIADMHRNPTTFAKRSVSGNTVLMARLAKAVTVAAKPEFRSKEDTEKALRKLIGGRRSGIAHAGAQFTARRPQVYTRERKARASAQEGRAAATANRRRAKATEEIFKHGKA
jgi:hypothetical protein